MSKITKERRAKTATRITLSLIPTIIIIAVWIQPGEMRYKIFESICMAALIAGIFFVLKPSE